MAFADTHAHARTLARTPLHLSLPQVYDSPSLLSTTFAAIVDQRLDTNNTLTWMNTDLAGSWYGPMKKKDFLICEFPPLLYIFVCLFGTGCGWGCGVGVCNPSSIQGLLGSK